jgi:cobalamin synthase
VAGLATCIGERLASPTDTGRAWQATLRGSIVLVLTYLLPILGWFVIIPASFIVGSGSAVLSLLDRTQYRLLPGSTGDAMGQATEASSIRI